MSYRMKLFLFKFNGVLRCLPGLTPSFPTRRSSDLDDQRHDSEVPAKQGATAKKRPEQETAEQRADDTNNDVEQDALLGVGAHDDAREPADDAPDDQCNDEIHLLPSCTHCRRTREVSAAFRFQDARSARLFLQTVAHSGAWIGRARRGCLTSFRKSIEGATLGRARSEEQTY